MAKTSRKNGSSNFSKKMDSALGSEASIETSKPASSQIPVKTIGASKTKTAASITRQQIEERARAIWQKKGCPVGQDDKNWQEAESQLKQELGV
jgi:hypothetical protein